MSKSLIKNAGYNILYKLFNLIFPLITSMYIARILSPVGVGQVAYAQNIMTYFLLLASLGIPNYGVREIAKARKNKLDVQKTFSELFLINLISSILFAGAYYLFITYNIVFEHNRELYYAVGINLLFNVINIDWFYQGYEEYRYITIRSLLVKVLSLIAVLLFVKTSNDIIIYAGITAFATVGNYIFNILNLKRYVSITFKNLQLLKHIKPILILFASVISIELYTLLDTTMLGIMTNDATIGYYTTSVKTVKIVTSIIVATEAVLLPRLSYYVENNLGNDFYIAVNNTFKFIFWAAVASSVGMFLIADEAIVFLFGVDFAPAIATTKVLCVLIFAISLNNFFGTQLLITLGKEKSLLISVICGAILNAILNFALIPIYREVGAAVASSCSEVLVLLLTMYFAMKHIKVDFDSCFIRSTIVSAVFMIISVAIIEHTISHVPLLILLFIKVIVGASAYIFMSYFTKNQQQY